MRTSETTGAIFKALIKASEKVKNLSPSAEGYGYSYIPLDKVIDHLREVLPSCGLAYLQFPSDAGTDRIGLCTRIIHESGEWVEENATFSLAGMKGVNKAQDSGAAITYFRRYALCAAFGITGDDDTDAADRKEGDEARSKLFEADLSKVKTAPTLDQLKEIYTDLYKIYTTDKERASLNNAKNARKQELGGAK